MNPFCLKLDFYVIVYVWLTFGSCDMPFSYSHALRYLYAYLLVIEV